MASFVKFSMATFNKLVYNRSYELFNALRQTNRSS